MSVGTSSTSRPRRAKPYGAAAADPESFWAVLERLIEESGTAWTFLRPTGFAKNTLGWAEQIRADGAVRQPYGQAARSMIDERDIAAVATEGTAVVLTQVHARARATGRELDFPILQTILVQDGRIAEVRPVCWDTAAIACA